MTAAAKGEMTLEQAIAVFDKSADRTRPNAQTEAWAVIRASLPTGGPGGAVAFRWHDDRAHTSQWYGIKDNDEWYQQALDSGNRIEYAYNRPPSAPPVAALRGLEAKYRKRAENWATQSSPHAQGHRKQAEDAANDIAAILAGAQEGAK